MRNRAGALAALLILFCILRSSTLVDSKTHFHTPEEIQFYQNHLQRTPLDSGEYFALPQNCKGCHGYDSLGLANVDLNGVDVNLFDDWETSMMALSAKDPLWKAKVSHEILVNPSHANELQTLCTKCHAPLGNYHAMYKGATHYTLADLANDSLGQSGVSCHSCHGIKDSSSLGILFTGQIPYDTNRFIYGPFPGPMLGPMQLYEALTPTYGPHMSESKACSPCHTLISSSADLSGQPTGTSFVEQATYHEYVNSAFYNQRTCQSCHMPQIEDPVKIANGYTALQGRSPFNTHTFQGGNSFMVQLMKNNKTTLDISASDANFDSTINANLRMLRDSTLKVTARFDTSMNDTAYLSLEILNKAGHKFPSGYPSRRAVVQFVILKSNGDTLFASGLFDSNYEILNPVQPFTPHYEIINDPSQTQIYEMVMGDVNGNKTTVLERGYSHLKDNRIPPLGFTTSHTVYDTCEIAGNALTDTDFNKIAGVEGSGADIIRYHIPLSGYSGMMSVKAKVYFQSVPPGWLNEMQQFSSAEIDTFLQMFANADHTPVLAGSDSILNINVSTGIKSVAFNQITISPNPTYDGLISIKGIASETKLAVYDSQGRLLDIESVSTSSSTLIQLPVTKGVYYLILKTKGNKQLKKIIRL